MAHGRERTFVVAVDIFTGKKVEQVFRHNDVVHVPIVEYRDYLLLDIAYDGYCSLLLDDGNTREDLRYVISAFVQQFEPNQRVEKYH